jgi:branched-chain amino acid transport system permease protein
MPRLFAPGRFRSSVVGWAVLAVPLLVVGVLVRSSGSSLAETTLISFYLDAILVLGFQVFIGDTGIISFGHVAFMGIGAYTAALTTIPTSIKLTQLPTLPGWLADVQLGLIGSVALGAAMAALVAGILGGALVRMRESAFAMGTLALLVVGNSVLSNWSNVTRGTIGIYGVPPNTSAWVALGGLLVIALVARLYRFSRPGFHVQATREDPLAAAASGINVPVSRFGSWVLSAAIMGAGGALWAQAFSAFGPDEFFFDSTFALLAMLVIGGRASVTGAVVGAAIVTLVEDTLGQIEQGGRVIGVSIPHIPGLVRFSIALLIILSLVFRPQGLLGRWEADDVLRRIWVRLRHPRTTSADLAPASGGVPEVAVGAAVGASPAADASPEERVLVARGVAKSFEGLHALTGVDIEVRPRELVGLIGPNGSGKTTLLNVLSGVYAPEGGSVDLLGRDVTGSPAYRIARSGIARTFQSIRLFPELTVLENIEAAALASDGAEVDRLVHTMRLEPVLGELAGNLAYGVQRRAEIARAGVRRPSLLLLDEPAAGMNEAESDELLESIHAIRDHLGCAVLIVDHDLRLIMQLCERIQVLSEGRTIAMGSPEAVANDPQVIDAYLGSPSVSTRAPVTEAPPSIDGG